MKNNAFRHLVFVSSFCFAAILYGGSITVDNWTVTTPDAPNAGRPNVLCVGDSILGGYGPKLRTLLSGKANVYTWNMAFFSTPGARGIPTNSVNSVSALADFSMVVFNNGLHSYNWNAGSVSDADISASYQALAETLAAANPHAKLFYLATTPHTGDKSGSTGVVSGYGAYNDVMKRLNRLARTVMLDAGVPFLDAYSLLSPRLVLASGDHFHWQGAAYDLLANLVATAFGFAEPAALATTTVNSGVSNKDGCIYAMEDGSHRGFFVDVALHCGRSTGPAYYSGIIFPALPGSYYTKATLCLPVDTSAASSANVDVWGLGYTASPDTPWDLKMDIWADTDTQAWYNNRTPVKLCDNILPAGQVASGSLSCDVTRFTVQCLNRAGTTNAYAIVRVNPDATPTDKTIFNDVNNHSTNPSRFVYTVPADPIAQPLETLASSGLVSAGYRSLPASWVQYAESDRVGDDYPAVLGRVNGKDRNLILRLPLPAVDGTLVTALNLVVTPVATALAKIPEGIDIDVWALGVEDVAANADASLAVNPFLTGTSDTRALLGGATPVRLGTVARGGTVLVPGQTLAGDAAFETALQDWLNEQIEAAPLPTTSTRYIVLRVNATAASPSGALDWGFGIGSLATGGLASTLELVAGTAASELPEAVDGVVTLLPNVVYTFTETNNFTGVTNIVTSTGTEIVFNISSNAVLTLGSAITGPGMVHKTGLGSLVYANTGLTAYRVGAGTRVEEGELHLPEFRSQVEFDLGSVYVAEGATLFVAGSDAMANTRTKFNNLSGTGLVTNGWAAAQVLQQNQGTTSPGFAGRLGGTLSNFWIYPNARINLTGTDSTATSTGGMPGFGTLGVTKIGYDKDDPSSVGRNTIFDLGPNSSGSSAALVYLGATGETTTKAVHFQPWDGSGGTCILDAGEGGLVWNGYWKFSKSMMVPAVIQGDGFATNVMAGAIYDYTPRDNSTAGTTHLEKRGAGTWFLKPTASGHRGVTTVKEGKLLFETLREKGVACSLGLSTMTYAFCWNGKTLDETKAVPYAFALGGGTKGEAVLECVGKAGSTTPNSAKERPLVLAGDGRLATTCAEAFSLRGVSSIASKPVTLSLDGSNAASALDTVTDGSSALSVAKDGSGTWTLCGELGFTGSLAVNAGTLEIKGFDIPYTWYKYVIKTMNSYYYGSTDSCRVTAEFALYDAEGIRRNAGANMVMTTSSASQLQPGEATVVEDSARNYSGGTWAFTNPSFYLQNMFDDNGGTSCFLAGPGNGTAASTWISVAMRLPEDTPPIVAYDLISNSGTWNGGTRRVVAYSVLGSYDGITWTELANQTTNETSRFTSGWYSDGSGFAAGAVRKLSEGHGIAIAPYPAAPEGLTTQRLNVASVTVAPGATLRAKGTVLLNRLDAALDSEGQPIAGGAIEGFTVPKNGTLYLSGRIDSGTELPYTFADMKDAANFRSWTIVEGGVVKPNRRLAVRGTSRLAVCDDGFVLFLR